MNEFLGCTNIITYSEKPMNPAAVNFWGNFEAEIKIEYNMALEFCPECAAVAFQFEEIEIEECALNFEYQENIGSRVKLDIELKGPQGVYKTIHVDGAEEVRLNDMRPDTTEITVICMKEKNIGKREQVRIYL